tara:strand:- start:954 stop:1151 length:198 start_codon:yes stop_codon:yes gene_type:complete
MTKVFSIWRFVFMIGWAKTLTWCVTNEREERTLFLSLHTVKEAGTNINAYGLIVGPISFTFGFAS